MRISRKGSKGMRSSWIAVALALIATLSTPGAMAAGETIEEVRMVGARLSGNRVTTLVDGVPVADQFDVDSFSNAGQDYLIPDAISRVEILHGPASTLFGSDALGGVIAVLTRDPEEYLDPGRDTGVSTTLAWSGMTAVAAQDRVDASAGPRFEPDSHVVVDLSARWQPNADVQLNLGLCNLGDQTYWHWASVRGHPEGDPLIDVLAAPGRHGAVSLRIRL